MADKKISQLSAASTPLAGTEVLPVVQGGSTVQVSVANLTAGRAVSASSVSVTGNVVISTSGQGIDFAATAGPTSGTMTSELLDDYEEGTWTPTLGAEVAGNLSVAYSVRLGTYTKVGRLVTASCRMVTSSFTHTTAADDAQIQGLPFAARTLTNMRTVGSLALFGANKAGFTQVNTQIDNASSSASFVATGVAGGSISSVKITEIASGGTPFVIATMVYETDS